MAAEKQPFLLHFYDIFCIFVKTEIYERKRNYYRRK